MKPPMIHTIVDNSCKVVGGSIVFAEINAFLSGDRVQQVGLLLAGALTWGFHFLWDQRKKRREAKIADEHAKRSQRILNTLERRVRADIDGGKPLPYPELMHLLVDRDVPKDEAGESK